MSGKALPAFLATALVYVVSVLVINSAAIAAVDLRGNRLVAERFKTPSFVPVAEPRIAVIPKAVVIPNHAPDIYPERVSPLESNKFLLRDVCSSPVLYFRAGNTPRGSTREAHRGRGS